MARQLLKGADRLVNELVVRDWGRASRSWWNQTPWLSGRAKLSNHSIL
jgi:hypothetical protein